MTRINLVDPSVLSTPHLVAEYRELPRIFKLINEANSKGKTDINYSIPSQYTLGKGHVTFFYNKGAFLTQRWFSLQAELINRKINTDTDYINYVYGLISALPSWCYKGDNISSVNKAWKPSPAEIYLSMFRLSNKFFGTEETTEHLGFVQQVVTREMQKQKRSNQ